jgi:hypothetical protein
LLSQVSVDLQRSKSPRVRRYVAGAAFERVFEITIALLKMVRAKKKPLRPVNLSVPRHRRRFPICSRSHRSLKAGAIAGASTAMIVSAVFVFQPVVRLGE